MALSTRDIKVTGIVGEQIIDDRLGDVEVSRIYYNIGDFGPYSVVIPKLELTAQRVLLDVRTDAQKLIDILNLTF